MIFLGDEMSFIIRDVIHNDIEFDDKIKQILSCSEFQRLHRIHQLSCEYLVFPTATHTRFSHSIGTYHIMKNLIAHFTLELKKLGYEVKDEDKNLAYIAALLHDVGHGAFSHTFEKIFGVKSHEQWTIEIISDENTSIHKKIVDLYGDEFIKRLISIISKSYKDDEKTKIFDIIATLVSSQTDADRMDYLLRDSYFTSVTNGRYDIQRLIKSFGVKEEDDKLKIFINEKYMSTLEEYVMARYFMHKEVYQHNIKQHMEKCLKLLFKRANELFMNNEDIFCDIVLKKLILGQKITVDEYLTTDDGYFMYHIKNWSNHKDKILSYLCKCFLNRQLFDYETDESKEELIAKINNLLQKNSCETIKNLDYEYFYIRTDKKGALYANTKENIWINSRNNEKLCDLSEKSLLINKQNASEIFTSSNNYISSYLFALKFGINIKL